MGLFADYVVATPEQAARYPSFTRADLEGRGAPMRRHIEGPTRLALGQLWADLVDEAWNASAHRLDAVAETGPDDGGLWQMDVFPAGFREVLESVPSARVDVALERWLAREEMRGWTPAAGREFFSHLQALAGSARVQGRALYLYTTD